MKIPALVLSLAIAVTPFAAAGSEAMVLSDRAEMARTMLPYNLNKIDRAVSLTAEQKTAVTAILEREVAAIAALQSEYVKHRDFGKIVNAVVDVNINTALELQKVLTKEQTPKLRAFFRDRHSDMVANLEAYVNTVWIEKAEKAGFTVEY